MNIYSLTHASDLDGMASAAMLVRYYKVPIGNVFFGSYSGKIFEDSMKLISGIEGPGNLLVIADIGMVSEDLERIADVLSDFKKRGNYVFWLDHHVWTDDEVKRMSDICDFMIVGENKDFCGTELVYKFLCPRDKFGDRLANFTHVSDFALDSAIANDNKLIKKISMSVKYLNDGRIANPKLRDFVSCLASGSLDCNVINNAYSEYFRESRPYLKEALESANIIEVNGIRIALSFGRKLSSQEACMELMKRKNADVAIFVNVESGDGSIRSARDTDSWGVENTGMAKALKGGGHPLASGFSLGKKQQLGTTAGQEKMIKRVRGIAQKLYGKRIMYYQQNTGKFSTR